VDLCEEGAYDESTPLRADTQPQVGQVPPPIFLLYGRRALMQASGGNRAKYRLILEILLRRDLGEHALSRCYHQEADGLSKSMAKRKKAQLKRQDGTS
jgi:hypothetical protein